MKALSRVAGVTAFLLSGAAWAEPAEVLPLSRLATPGVKPVATASSETRCPADTGGLYLAGSRTIGAARITLWHDCGHSDEMGVMAIQLGDAYFFAADKTIHYSAGNMTEFPLHESLVSDRVVPVTLADRSTAVMQVVTTEWRGVNAQTGAVGFDELHQAVQVCTLDDKPACASANDAICPKGGCVAPTMSRGVLRLVDRNVKQRVIRVERAPAPQPPP